MRPVLLEIHISYSTRLRSSALIRPIPNATSLPGPRVLRVLDQLIAWYGIPKRTTLDNGPEFAGRALDAWAYAHRVTLDFIEPGKPTQNGRLES